MKNYETYEFTIASQNEIIYSFTSIGPKGPTKKVVQFQEADPRVYHLVVGNLAEDGHIDDLSINNNGDRDKIIATVASIIINVTEKHPDHYIFFGGSTKARTRLYRMAISLNFEEITKTFKVWGLHNDSGLESFDSTRPYEAFLIRAK